MVAPTGDVCASINEMLAFASIVPTSSVVVPRVAELPTCQKTFAALRAVDKIDVGSACRRQRAANLKDENSVRVALTVQRQRSGQLRRRGEGVNARREGKAAKNPVQSGCPWDASPAATLYAVRASPWAVAATASPACSFRCNSLGEIQ